jgi:hypothetical protein
MLLLSSGLFPNVVNPPPCVSVLMQRNIHRALRHLVNIRRISVDPHFPIMTVALSDRPLERGDRAAAHRSPKAARRDRRARQC